MDANYLNLIGLPIIGASPGKACSQPVLSQVPVSAPNVGAVAVHDCIERVSTVEVHSERLRYAPPPLDAPPPGPPCIDETSKVCCQAPGYGKYVEIANFCQFPYGYCIYLCVHNTIYTYIYPVRKRCTRHRAFYLMLSLACGRIALFV